MKYKIYCGNDLIHHQDIEELKITNAVVELEQNAIGTFEFDIYPTNPYINNVKDMQSEITVYQDNYLLFKGLACNSQIGYRNKKKVACKQDYFYLTFSAIEPYEFTGTPQELFEKFINEHNSQVDAKHQFKIGTCSVTDPNDYITRSNEESQSAWENLQSKLVEMLGGYLRVRYEDDGAYLDYLSDFSTKNVQDIKFGENLLDVTRENTGLDIATVIVPYGAQDEETGKRVTIAEVNDGKIYVEDAEAIAKHGRIRKVVTWDDVTEPYNLLRKAREWLGANKSKIVGITITAFDLAHTDKDIGSFKMFSYIKVISEYHSLNDLYLPLKMRIDLFNVKNNKIELNTTGKSFTDYQIKESKKYTNVIETVTKIENNVTVPKVELHSNLGLFQKYDKTSNSYLPDFRATNLIITPSVFLSSNAIDLTSCVVTFTRSVNGVESELVDGETIIDNQLVVNENVIDTTVMYTCSVTFTSNGKTYKAKSTITIALVANGIDGENATVLRIDSSRGTVFKNNQLQTVLSVVVYYGGKKIEDIDTLHAVYGAGAYFQWSWQRLDDERFGVIAASDPRITNNGFSFVLTADDVDTKVVFQCDLITS